MSIPRSMTCPRCGDDLEYEVERDGTAWVLFEPLVVTPERPGDYHEPIQGEQWTHGMTTCGCIFSADELERLHDEATKRAGIAWREYEP